MELINPYRLFNGSFIPDWLLIRPEISPGAKLLYARLVRYSGADGYVCPKIKTIGSELGLSSRTVDRCLAELKNNLLIICHRRGLGKSNLYFFLRHEWMELDKNPKWNRQLVDSQICQDGVTETPSWRFRDAKLAHPIKVSEETNTKRVTLNKDAPTVDLANQKSNQKHPKAWLSIADKIYQSDQTRFKRLVVWIRQKESESVPESIIDLALRQFWVQEQKESLENWWPYLNEICKKEHIKYNASQTAADNERLKREEREWLKRQAVKYAKHN